jgi:hypothetical protein
MDQRKIVYQCVECDHQFVDINTDGRSCPKCKGYISPIGDYNCVDYPELSYIPKKDRDIKFKIEVDTSELKKELNEIESLLDRIIEKKKMMIGIDLGSGLDYTSMSDTYLALSESLSKTTDKCLDEAKING